MARTRAATYDAQRLFILETAAQAFAELGFPSASMNDIARRCGVSKGLLYHYYAAKEQLLFDVTDQYTRRLVALVDDVEQRTPDPALRLPALIRSFLDEYQTSQARHMVLLHDLRFLPARERRMIIDNERRVVEAFAVAIRAAHRLPADVPIVKPITMMLFGMMNWTFTWLKPDKGLSYAEFADMVSEVFAAGVAALAQRLLITKPSIKAAAQRTSRTPRFAD
jgi:AcrR family transcriptional regulator